MGVIYVRSPSALKILGKISPDIAKRLDTGKTNTSSNTKSNTNSNRKSTVNNNKGNNDGYQAPRGGGGVTAEIKVGNNTITFGHGGRHLGGTGLDMNTVNRTIANDVTKQNLGKGQFHKGIVMSNQHLQNWYKLKRDLSNEEKKWFNKLLSVDFDGRDSLLKQLEYAKVIGSCLCGCRTIDIIIESTSTPFSHQIRVPVEMIVNNDNHAPIVFYLHVLDGYIKELEVFKADSSEIIELVRLDDAIISVNSN